MSLGRIETRLRQMLAEHEAGEQDGNPEVSHAHEVLAQMLREDLAEIDRLRASESRARAEVLRESRSPCCSAAIRCGRCGGDLAYPWPDEAERGGRWERTR